MKVNPWNRAKEQWTPMLGVHIKKMPDLQGVSNITKEQQGPTLGHCFGQVSIKREFTIMTHINNSQRKIGLIVKFFYTATQKLSEKRGENIHADIMDPKVKFIQRNKVLITVYKKLSGASRNVNDYKIILTLFYCNTF